MKLFHKLIQEQIHLLDQEIGILLTKRRKLVQTQKKEIQNAFEKLNTAQKRKRDIFENNDFVQLEEILKKEKEDQNQEKSEK